MGILATHPAKYTLYGASDNLTNGVTKFFQGGSNIFFPFSTTGGNDPNTGSSYTFRTEDVLVGRVPTIRRIVLSYINVGVVTLTFTLAGTNDLGTIITQTTTKTIGKATGLAYNPNPTIALIDLQLTAYCPQLTISRAANGGGFVIVSVLLTGTVEDQEL